MKRPPLPRSIHLRAAVPSRNIARAYSISMGVDLLGSWTVDTQRGRIGSVGQSRRICFADRSQARRFVLMLLRRRRTARARIGTAYHLMRCP